MGVEAQSPLEEREGAYRSFVVDVTYRQVIQLVAEVSMNVLLQLVEQDLADDHAQVVA